MKSFAFLNSIFPITLRCFVLTGLCLWSINARAEIIESIRYVSVNHQQHTAYIYDEKFNRLTDNPYVPGTSIEMLPEDQTYWMLGYTVDMIRRTPNGELEVVTSRPEFSEMNHHFVMIYNTPDRPLPQPCVLHTSPIAVGSEFTDIILPEGYAYKLQGGALMGASWHWMNPAGLSHEEDVYIRLTYKLDTENQGYKNTHASWIGAEPCSEDFSIPSGRSTKISPDYPVLKKQRLVLSQPHTHDHVKKMDLLYDGKKVLRVKPGYTSTYVAHDDVGEGETAWHLDKNHLPAGGLPVWSPGKDGPIFEVGSVLSVIGEFKNPHPQSIDNMLIFFNFWEELE